ncbi:MAG: ABC transporter substrate-binding protein [Fimbriimonas sp.]
MPIRPPLRLLALLPLFALSGCDDPVPPGKISLRYMAWGNPEQMALEESFCAKFNAENPDIHVRFLKVPNSAYQNKAIVMMASRTAPDILRIDQYAFPSLVKKKYFLDLTDLAAKDKEFRREDFFPQAIGEGQHEGRQYGMNVLFGGMILYYNKTMVREAGLEDPYQLWKQGKWTYDRYREHAIAMTKRGEDGKVKQFGCVIPGWPYLVSVVRAFGGEILSADGKRSLLGEPESVRAHQFLADLRWKDKCAPTPAQAANAQYTFESGKVGMQFDWMGLSPRFRNLIKDFEWDVCPLPTGPGGFSSVVKGNQMVIYRESKHPEAAWRFVRFMTGVKVEKDLYIGHRRSAPTRRAVAYSPEFLETKAPPFQMDTFLRTLEGGEQLPITSRWSEWTTVLATEHEKLFSGSERDAGTVMRRAARRIDEVLADEEGY